MKVNVKAALMAKTAQEIEEQRKETITYITALGCAVCQNIRGFGKIRMRRLVRGTYEEITAFYEHYGGIPENGIDPAEIPTTFIGLRNCVQALNVPTDLIEARFAFSPDFKGWANSNAKQKRWARYEEIQRMDKVVRSYWYAMIMHLWHTYGWGAQRLIRFYTMVWERYSYVMELYLECRDYKDAFADDIMKQTIRAIKEMGVSV